MRRNAKGFSFIELLVTITIIAVLSAVAVVSYQQVTRKSRDSKRVSDLEQLRSALELYKADHSYYLDNGVCDGEGGIPSEWCTYVRATNALTDLVTEGYMGSIPQDPLGNDYWYLPRVESGPNYYGYCLSAAVEVIPTPAGAACAPASGDNYVVQNP